MIQQPFISNVSQHAYCLQQTKQNNQETGKGWLGKDLTNRDTLNPHEVGQEKPDKLYSHV